MNFTNNLKEILQNFSTINSSIVFKPGNTISTISPMKTIIGKAKTDTSFESTFAIYDLSRFLGAVYAFDDADFTVTDKSIIISPKDGSRSIDYTFAEPSLIIQPPEKEMVFPEVDVEFELKNDVLKEALKVANLIGSTELAISGDGEDLYLEATNTKDKSSNSYKAKLDKTTKKFRFVFLVDNMKVLPRDYKVRITAKGLSHFEASDVEYYIAIEASASKYEG